MDFAIKCTTVYYMGVGQPDSFHFTSPTPPSRPVGAESLFSDEGQPVLAVLLFLICSPTAGDQVKAKGQLGDGAPLLREMRRPTSTSR
jgi:hypothetical protein